MTDPTTSLVALTGFATLLVVAVHAHDALAEREARRREVERARILGAAQQARRDILYTPPEKP